jgi:hypothetical protein
LSRSGAAAAGAEDQRGEQYQIQMPGKRFGFQHVIASPVLMKVNGSRSNSNQGWIFCTAPFLRRHGQSCFLSSV